MRWKNYNLYFFLFSEKLFIFFIMEYSHFSSLKNKKIQSLFQHFNKETLERCDIILTQQHIKIIDPTAFLKIEEIQYINLLILFTYYIHNRLQEPVKYEEIIRRKILGFYVGVNMKIKLFKYSYFCSRLLHYQIQECLHIHYFLIYNRFASPAYVAKLFKQGIENNKNRNFLQGQIDCENMKRKQSVNSITNSLITNNKMLSLLSPEYEELTDELKQIMQLQMNQNAANKLTKFTNIKKQPEYQVSIKPIKLYDNSGILNVLKQQNNSKDLKDINKAYKFIKKPETFTKKFSQLHHKNDDIKISKKNLHEIQFIKQEHVKKQSKQRFDIALGKVLHDKDKTKFILNQSKTINERIKNENLFMDNIRRSYNANTYYIKSNEQSKKFNNNIYNISEFDELKDIKELKRLRTEGQQKNNPKMKQIYLNNNEQNKRESIILNKNKNFQQDDSSKRQNNRIYRYDRIHERSSCNLNNSKSIVYKKAYKQLIKSQYFQQHTFN